MNPRWPAFTGIVLAITACNAVLGLDERKPRDLGDGGAGGGCAAACVASVPAGWSGPTVVTAAESTSRCDTAYPNVELSLFDESTASAADCACDCAPAVGIDCSASVVAINTYSDNACANPRDSGSGVLGECIDLCCSGDSANYVAPTPDSRRATCAPVTVADAAAAPSWAQHLTGCGPVARVSCAGESCFLPRAGERMCIYQTGEHPCPEGPFSQRSLWFAGYDDTRACEPCACGPVDAASCNEVVEAYSNTACVNNPAVIVPSPGCTTAPADFDAARVLSVDPEGSCSPSGGAPIGGVTPTQATTVCCWE